MSAPWYRSGEALLAEITSTEVPKDAIALWFLSQESMVFKSGKRVIYIDPFLSPGEKRKYAPPFSPEQVSNADWIVGTHHHRDHIDPATLGPMAKASPEARFVVPAPHVHMLTAVGIDPGRITKAHADQRLELGDFAVTPIKAAHETFETDESGDHKFLGYVFEFGGIRLYHAGDTVDYPGLVERLKGFDLHVACLPINGHDRKRNARNIVGNLTPREAVDLGVDCGADLLIPLHYDLFFGNQENPATFVDYLYGNYPNQKFHIMAPGERFFYLLR
ncbi:MAG TPA: MBL fold metallo-hydrolase [Limnochordia bacterium]|nr:MBL fold metallo-hydrolase [Limnochordia bacterium]